MSEQREKGMSIGEAVRKCAELRLQPVICKWMDTRKERNR